MVVEEEFASGWSDEALSGPLDSESEVRTMRSIDVPAMQLTVPTLRLIYESPQPLIVTLSLCLFIRYFIRKEIDLLSRGWLLSLSAMAAYKLSYDEEVEGLLECFA